MTNEELEEFTKDKRRVAEALGLLNEKAAKQSSHEADNERFHNLTRNVPAHQWKSEDIEFVRTKSKEALGL